MANKKITELTALTTPASTDVLAIVDVAGAETKKITVANLTGGGGLLTQVETTVTNAQVLTMKYDNAPITLVAAEAGKIHVPVGVCSYVWKSRGKLKRRYACGVGRGNFCFRGLLQ